MQSAHSKVTCSDVLIPVGQFYPQVAVQWAHANAQANEFTRER